MTDNTTKPPTADGVSESAGKRASFDTKGKRDNRASARRKPKLLTYKNETHSIKEWAKKLNIYEATIRTRLHKGWSVEDTLGRPQDKLKGSQKWRDNSVTLTYNGKTLTLAGWSRELGLSLSTLIARMSLGLTTSQILDSKRRSRKSPTIEFSGRILSIDQWSAETGISVLTLLGRRKAGWSNAQILGYSPTPHMKKISEARKKKEIMKEEIAKRRLAAEKERAERDAAILAHWDRVLGPATSPTSPANERSVSSGAEGPTMSPSSPTDVGTIMTGSEFHGLLRTIRWSLRQLCDVTGYPLSTVRLWQKDRQGASSIPPEVAAWMRRLAQAILDNPPPKRPRSEPAVALQEEAGSQPPRPRGRPRKVEEAA